MRYFLKIIQNGLQIGVKRIEPKQQITTTDQLICLINKKLNLDNYRFTIKIIHAQHKLKIVSGWTLAHYRLRPGMQIEVQLLPSIGEEKSIKKYLLGGELFFEKRAMSNITQEDEQDKQEFQQISYLVVKKYEELLKLIQKNNTQGYLKQMAMKNPGLGPCQNQFYIKELRQIQNELGAEGWAAIHYAVFLGNIQITTYLIQLGVDLNIKTFDDWLPIHFAVKQENLLMIDLLLQQPTTNVNICTLHGLAFNMAVESLNKQIVFKLLKKDINFYAKDHLGRTAYDILQTNNDKQMLVLIRKAEERQSYDNTMGQNNMMYHGLVSLFRGYVIRVQSPFNYKDCYLCINPYEKAMYLYQDKLNYPSDPKQKIPISRATKVKLMQHGEKSWYMKSNLSYFYVLSDFQKFLFGCHLEQAAKKWVSAFAKCFNHILQFPYSITKFQRNDTVIQDRIQEDWSKKKSTNYNQNSIPFLLSCQISKKISESLTQSKTSLQLKKTQTSYKEKQQEYEQKRNNIKENLLSESHPSTLKLAYFRIIKKLGQGTFGAVFLAVDLRVSEKTKYYALKIFKKKKLSINNQIKYTISELNILKQLSHPYIINLHFAFQTPNYLYLGLDYCPNRNLSYYLMRNVTLGEKQAMIYIGEILLALSYLHDKNIIYRDLKPENVMFDSQWHIKLIDFGLSKQVKQKDFLAKSFCGSPAYLPPEMLSKKGVGRQSDFYCLGSLLYEMIVGEPPFFSDDVATLYRKILESKLEFPKGISEEAKNLLTNLLERNPQKRLGCKGVSQIKNHQFFKELNWNALENRSLKISVKEEMKIEELDTTPPKQTVHQDFDYTPENYRVNRLQNFNFVRQLTVHD